MQLVALFTLGFHSATYHKYLTLLHTVTRWLVLQKARRHTHMVLRPVVSVWFQVLFHSPSGVLFNFPSRYWFTIGGRRYLALGGGPPGFPQGFSCPVVLGCLAKESRTFRLQGFHPLWPAFPCRSARYRISYSFAGSTAPARKVPQPP